MHIKSIALAATTLVISTSVNAARITNLTNININGTLYDVTFHTAGAGDSFNALWDADDDGVFGGGGSTFATAPTFWGDEVAATAAASAIMNALTDFDYTTINLNDSFAIPVAGLTSDDGGIIQGSELIRVLRDDNPDRLTDLLGTGSLNDSGPTGTTPYASFVESVPVPAAVWLFGSGLLGLIGVARRKARA